jgi:hypothetical protein
MGRTCQVQKCFLIGVRIFHANAAAKRYLVPVCNIDTLDDRSLRSMPDNAPRLAATPKPADPLDVQRPRQSSNPSFGRRVGNSAAQSVMVFS